MSMQKISLRLFLPFCFEPAFIPILALHLNYFNCRYFTFSLRTSTFPLFKQNFDGILSGWMTKLWANIETRQIRCGSDTVYIKRKIGANPGQSITCRCEVVLASKALQIIHKINHQIYFLNEYGN
jgi:hypothetical protein